jgi:hypothetical protein
MTRAFASSATTSLHLFFSLNELSPMKKKDSDKTVFGA